MNLTAHKQQQDRIDEQPGMKGILGDALRFAAKEIISLLGDEARRARLSGEAAGLAARREQGALTAEFMRRNNLE